MAEQNNSPPEAGPQKYTNQKITASTDLDEQPGEKSFPIIGIGASAGGLEAFKEFFIHMPPDNGMAFVLVQHLDPTHESILVDLIKRYSRMEVFQVKDGIKVRPNCIYVIPPNRDMALLHGALHLMEPAARRGLRLPIDFFFRSLAEDQGEKSIGVVLSGTGSDGTLGLKAIKGEGGLAVVQDPMSAKYDGMPRSAISTGLIDYILPPSEMAEQLLGYIKHAFIARLKKTEPLLPQAASSLQKIFILLRNHTGYDFSLYKNNTIGRRIERRMTVNQIEYIADYVRYLQQNPVEVEALFRELLIGVTRFFRDQEAFVALEQKVIPRLFVNRQANDPLRVWAPGCSTGEEAYSIAILLREQMERLKQPFDVQLFATDIDSHAIEKARNALYPDGIVADVSSERLARFFVKEGNTYKVGKPIRDMVIFAVQSVIKDPPFSKIDLISCRNLLIYLGPELQKQVLRLFHYSLKPAGFLFLGNSETISSAADRYTAIDKPWRIFQRPQGAITSRGTLDFTGQALLNYQFEPERQVDKSINMRELTEKILLEDYTPSCVIVNEQSEVVYFHGRTGKYLEPASGKANFNVLRMAKEGLRMPLTAAIRKVIAQKQEMVQEHLQIKTNGKVQSIRLTVKPILEPAAMKGLLMIIFEDMPPPQWAEPLETILDDADQRDRRLAILKQELKSTKEYLQTTVEELETSNEDLRFANEALQSANEELQSTNEELETSQEELQSVNEELVTVNSELQLKIEALTQANNDINNLLTNTRIGTIFLDSHLRIQRFTPTATQVVNLIETDIGRPLNHISSNLIYDHLVKDTQHVLNTLEIKEAEVQTLNGRWFWMQAMPYRTVENVIDGVVLTFTDITEQKKLQEQLRHLKRAIEQSSGMVIVTDAAGTIEYVNPKFTEVTGYTLDEVRGKNPRLLQSGQHKPEFYQRLWQAINAGESWQGEFHDKKKSGEFYWQSASIAPVKNGDDKITHFIAIAEDITQRKQAEQALRKAQDQLELRVKERTTELMTANEQLQKEVAERKQAEQALQESEGKLQTILETAPQGIVIVTGEGQISFVNHSAEEMFGYSRVELVGQLVEILVPERFRDDHVKHRADYLAAAQPRPMGNNLILIGRRKDGAEFPAEIGLNIIETKQGVLVTSFITDITRREQEMLSG